MKKTQAQQNPNQIQGGDAMKKEQLQQAQQNQQETQIYFVTFPYKVDSQIAKEIIMELRKRFPLKTPIFAPRPPYNGKRMVLNINEIPVIVTFPYLKKNPNPNTQQASQNQGFTLGELIKNKKT